MTIDSRELLKRLTPAVSPVSTGRVAAARAPLDAQSFDDLLTLVSSGAIRSERAVAMGPGIEPALTDEEQARLAAAADLAESAGVRTALMLLDGRGLVLDVAGRTVTDELTGAAPTSVVPLEAAVYVAADDVDSAPSAREMLATLTAAAHAAPPSSPQTAPADRAPASRSAAANHSSHPPAPRAPAA